MRPTPKPIESVLPIAGLKHPFTILQITDLHASAVSEEDAAAMSAERHEYAVHRNIAFSQGRPYPPDAVLPVLGDYAGEIGADVILLTGDILDFPSEANFALLDRFIQNSAIPVRYITGNHDWSYADDYHTPHAKATHLPRVTAIAKAQQDTAVYETEDVLLVTIDNTRYHISEGAVVAYTAAATRARETDKTLILAMHIPFKVDTLVEDTVRVWGQDLCLGEGATGGQDPTTVAFWREITEGTQIAPDVVITGHLHFDHEDVYPNGVRQYITDIASGGHCRLIRLIPQV